MVRRGIRILGLVLAMTPSCSLDRSGLAPSKEERIRDPMPEAGASASSGQGGASSTGGSGGQAGAGGQGGSAPVSITCRSTTCAPGEICCVTKQKDPTEQACAAPDACAGVIARCDGPEDCPNQLCCGDFNVTEDRYLSVACGTQCDGSAPKPIVCHFPVIAVDDCPSPLHCVDSIYMPTGFGRCSQ